MVIAVEYKQDEPVVQKNNKYYSGRMQEILVDMLEIAIMPRHLRGLAKITDFQAKAFGAFSEEKGTAQKMDGFYWPTVESLKLVAEHREQNGLCTLSEYFGCLESSVRSEGSDYGL